MTKEERILIGHVGVDSGQLVLCDPTYIDSQWSETDKAALMAAIGHPPLRDIKTGKQYRVFEDFPNYNAKLLPGDNRTVNELRDQGRLVEVDTRTEKEKNGPFPFSYLGACLATRTDNQGGSLVFQLGHEGAGVAFHTGFGDGVYPVYATIRDIPDAGRRIVKIEVLFVDDEDRHPYDEGFGT